MLSHTIPWLLFFFKRRFFFSSSSSLHHHHHRIWFFTSLCLIPPLAACVRATLWATSVSCTIIIIIVPVRTVYWLKKKNRMKNRWVLLQFLPSQECFKCVHTSKWGGSYLSSMVGCWLSGSEPKRSVHDVLGRYRGGGATVEVSGTFWVLSYILFLSLL